MKKHMFSTDMSICVGCICEEFAIRLSELRDFLYVTTLHFPILMKSLIFSMKVYPLLFSSIGRQLFDAYIAVPDTNGATLYEEKRGKSKSFKRENNISYSCLHSVSSPVIFNAQSCSWKTLRKYFFWNTIKIF